jgi:hypothetical protein
MPEREPRLNEIKKPEEEKPKMFFTKEGVGITEKEVEEEDKKRKENWREKFDRWREKQ